MGDILSIFSKQSAISHPVESYFNKITRYQILVFIILFSCKWPLFYHMISHIAISPKMKFYCGGEVVKHGSKVNYTGALNKCPCKGKVHWDTSVFTKTTHTKYGLYCDMEWIISLSKSVVFLGLLIGVFIFGVTADKIGRIPASSITFFLTGVSGCLVPAMPEVISFCIMRLIEGIGCGGAVVVTYVLLIEYCGPLNREPISALFHLPLNFAHMTLGVLSFYIRDCDHIMYAISVPTIIFGAIIFFLLESPKWLVDSNRITKANKVMSKICKFNKKPCDDFKSNIDTYLKNRPQDLKKVSIVQCFKYKQIILNFISMAILYFTCGLAYYGVSQYISEMSGDFHFNVFLSGAVLIPGTVTSVFLLKYLKRKPFVIICLIGSAIPFFIAIFLKPGLARVILACISNSFFFMLFIVVFLYGCEIFPTEVRNSMLGLLSLISRVGQLISPLIIAIKLQYIEIVFPIMSVLAALFLIFPPETKNALLPATIKEALGMSKKKKDQNTQTAK